MAEQNMLNEKKYWVEVLRRAVSVVRIFGCSLVSILRVMTRGWVLQVMEIFLDFPKFFFPEFDPFLNNI